MQQLQQRNVGKAKNFHQRKGKKKEIWKLFDFKESYENKISTHLKLLGHFHINTPIYYRTKHRKNSFLKRNKPLLTFFLWYCVKGYSTSYTARKAGKNKIMALLPYTDIWQHEGTVMI